MRTQPVEVNRLVTYVAAGKRLKPAVVTAVTSQTVVSLRIGHHTTLAAIAKQTADAEVNVWRFTDAFQNV